MRELRRRTTTFRLLGKLAVALALAVLWHGGVSALPAAAQAGGAFPQFVWGGRFLAAPLAGSPVDDGFAPMYNPAALRGCATRQIAVHQMRPFDVPVTGLAWCAGGDGDEGISEGPWMWGGHGVLRQSPPGLGFDYNTYQLGLVAAYRFSWTGGEITAGVAPKLLVVSIDGTGVATDETAAGGALDVGIGYDRPLRFAPGGEAGGGGPADGRAWLDRVSVDWSVTDLMSQIRYKSGATEPGSTATHRLAFTASGPRLTAGIHLRSQDGDTTWGGGLEYGVFQGAAEGAVLRQIVVRGGADARGAAVGFGVTVTGFAVDYAYRMEGDHGTHLFSTAWHF